MRIIDESGIISEEMRTIIGNTSDLMFVKNRNFVYIASSKAFALECIKRDCVDDIIGKTDFELFENQELASKYRQEDEKMFASGKAMSEFQEEYLDEEGKKHLCLTTKYLLHDKEGNPVAIFGQYHDICEQFEAEIARRSNMNQNVVAALSSTFFASNYVDLRTHKYIVLRSLDYTRKMLANCDTMEEAFDSFINTLVKPEFQNKMREFCDSDTIAQRVKGKKQIDCEYLSRVAVGWCRASFFPVEWDENGDVTHVLFAVSSIDEKKGKELEESILNRKSVEAIFDKVPGGIVMYKWDGKNIRTIRVSEYYAKKYGISVSSDEKSPDFDRVHPDDVEEYKKAIYKAMTQTHYLEYVFRVWNNEEKRYIWTQINAMVEPQSDGKAYIYAMYTDVTAQKNAEIELQKSHQSMVAALGASNQLCYEYDPVKHKGVCFTDTNFFGLPKNIENYPDSLREIDLFHPEDAETFIRTAHKIDDGEQKVQCDVRIKKNGKYCWYSCMFDAYHDLEKGYNVAILSVVDISLRIASIKVYEERIHSMLSIKDDVLSICSINLTQNTFKMVDAKSNMEAFVDESETFEHVMLGIVDNIVGDDDKKTYAETFCRENLLKQVAEGKMNVQMDYLLKFSENHYEWITAVVDMVQNPVSGEVGGIAYSKSSQIKHMANELLGTTLKLDYIFAAVVFRDSDEFYLYDSKKGEFGQRILNFWDVAITTPKPNCSNEASDYFKKYFNKKYILQYLDEHGEFGYAYDSKYADKQCRLEVKFRYLDKAHNMIMSTLRDITDSLLLDKWHYESEHDLLTGLYNRKTVFEKSRKILNEHPDEQFVMLHCDICHFHLYNTFFGEKAGDKLLCEIGTLIAEMGKDYEYWAYGRIESDVFCAFFPVEHGEFEPRINYFFRELAMFSRDFPVEPAIGVYYVNDSSMSMQSMFSRATIAAKSGKKNLFGLITKFDEAMEQSLKDTQQITSEMHAAIEKEQFEVYLQPKYSLRSEKLKGAEALVRWKHPERGMISPGKFIPVFEKNGFVAELDRYMWEHVCMILQRWSKEGKTMYPVSVNMSRISMYSHTTVPFLIDLIKKYNLDPKYLELELTESAYMDDPEDLKNMLKELQDFGFKILMDDFGSGYSSLNTLRELPVDILKLDMKFLSNTQTDKRGAAVLASVIRMSKLLNLPIVAEGVEKKEQANYLRDIGCEYVQGFLFAKPMPVEEYEKLLVSGENCDESKMKMSSENIMKLLSDNEGAANAISQIFPASLAFVEYEKDAMRILRANNLFLKQFELVEDQRPAPVIIKEKLDEHSYGVMMNSLKECANTKENVVFYVNWHSDGGDEKLLGAVKYEDTFNGIANMVMIFVNLNEVNE